MIEEILEYNKKFVEEKGYEPYVTSNTRIKRSQSLPVWILDLQVSFRLHWD